jgi:perosamine synthetase
MAVNIYGHPARLRELRLLANDLDLILIEDNAEAPFATCHGKPTGSFGHASTFSFFGNKVITSGEGGAVTTDDPEKNELMRTLRDHGMSRVQKYHFPYIGYNYRLNNLSAALLLAQIERKDETLRKRNELFLKYDAIFRNNDDFSIRPVSSWATSSPWLYSILAKNKELKEDLENRLRLNEIETRPLFRPIHLEPPYIGKSNCRISGELTVTSDISSRGLSLPTSSNFSRREIAHIMYVTKKSLQSIKA